VVLIRNTLYGTTAYGGFGGTVYSLNTDGTGFLVAFRFPGTENDPIGDFVISGNILSIRLGKNQACKLASAAR
jgi:hypothetical protein